MCPKDTTTLANDAMVNLLCATHGFAVWISLALYGVRLKTLSVVGVCSVGPSGGVVTTLRLSRRGPKLLRWVALVYEISAATFGGFSRGGFPENACIGGATSERNCCEICRRKSPQNIEKHTKQSSAQRFLN